MRLARPTLIALVTLVALAAPSFAKDAKAQKQSEEITSSNCHAYQLSTDGNWVALPCEEEGAQKSTHHRTVPKATNDEAR